MGVNWDDQGEDPHPSMQPMESRKEIDWIDRLLIGGAVALAIGIIVLFSVLA